MNRITFGSTRSTGIWSQVRGFSIKNDIFYLINGDSTKEESYKKLGLGKGQPLCDILITDPPYCLLTRRRPNGDIRDPKPRERKTDNSIEVLQKSVFQFVCCILWFIKTLLL